MAGNMRVLHNISAITIHCSLTKPSMNIGANEIRKWHVEDNEWADIGYHWVIRRSGVIQKGREMKYVGAHTYGHNTYKRGNNIGICLVGGLAEDSEGYAHTEDNFTAAQYIALGYLIKHVIEKKQGKQLPVFGHNDWSGHKSRGCPCFDVEMFTARLKEISDDILHMFNNLKSSSFYSETEEQPNDIYQQCEKLKVNTGISIEEAISIANNPPAPPPIRTVTDGDSSGLKRIWGTIKSWFS